MQFQSSTKESSMLLLPVVQCSHYTPTDVFYRSLIENVSRNKQVLLECPMSRCWARSISDAWMKLTHFWPHLSLIVIVWSDWIAKSLDFPLLIQYNHLLSFDKISVNPNSSTHWMRSYLKSYCCVIYQMWSIESKTQNSHVFLKLSLLCFASCNFVIWANAQLVLINPLLNLESWMNDHHFKLHSNIYQPVLSLQPRYYWNTLELSSIELSTNDWMMSSRVYHLAVIVHFECC